MAQPMPLPLTVSCFIKIQIGFTFLVPDHLGNPGKGPLNGCVCVCTKTEHESTTQKHVQNNPVRDTPHLTEDTSPVSDGEERHVKK